MFVRGFAEPATSQGVSLLIQFSIGFRKVLVRTNTSFLLAAFEAEAKCQRELLKR
jgi:hypothetical protein